jgi:hypothetical protein
VTTLKARVSTDDQVPPQKRDAVSPLGVAVSRWSGSTVDHGLTGTNRDRAGCTPSRR